MIRKLFYLSCLVMGFLFSVSSAVIAEEDIIPQGGIIVKDGDGVVQVEPLKMRVAHDDMQSRIDAGKLSDVKNTLDVAVIDDEQKDAAIRESLTQKIHKAEQAFNQYLVLKEAANGDLAQFQKAKEWLVKANSIWTDNYTFQSEQREIESLISLVESGRYEQWQANKNAEEEINSLIAEAKVCAVDSDCVRVGFGCPFGCGTAINKTMLEQIEAKVDAYHKDQEMMCRYDCYVPASLEAKCVGKVCKLE